MARKSSIYIKLFQQLDLQLLDIKFHQRSKRLLTDVEVYVLQAGMAN